MINTSKIPRAYSEVYAFINILGNEYKSKIPKKIYYNIENKRDKDYLPQYNIENINVKFSNEALALIASLNLQYWCEDSQEKERLKKVYYQNAKNEEEKYSYENIFKSNKVEKNEQEEVHNENTQLIEIKEENIFAKLINKVKRFFEKLKK